MVEAAGHGLDPHVGHADDRLVQIVIGEAYRLEHGSCPGAVAPVRDDVATMLGVEGHDYHQLKVSG